MPREGTKKCGKVANPFYSSTTRDFCQGIAVTFAFIITSFPKQQAEKSREGWCRLGSLSTSPAPSRPSHALPWLPDWSPPPPPYLPAPTAPSAHIEHSLTAVTWEGFRPACRYCSYFQIPIVSCHRCPYVLPLCISRQKDFVLVLLVLFFSFFLSFTFGLSSNVRAKDTRRWKEAPYFAYCLICCIYIDEMKPLL